MRTAVAGMWGVVFGVGLALGGMTNPAKVLAFLDVAGAWDPTLAFVMGGALAVSALGFALARRRERPWLAAGFSLPSRKDVDVPLVAGASFFGVGWGLVGLCPGPAIASLARGSTEIWIFVVAMAAGAFAQRAFVARRSREAGADRAPSPPFADRSPRARPSE